MNYIQTEADGQMKFSTERSKFLMIPSFLEGFNNSCTSVETSKSGRNVYCFRGTLDDTIDRTCPECGRRMHINNHLNVNLQHLCFGSTLTVVKCTKLQLRCPSCGLTQIQGVSFKADHHRITKELFTYTRDLLSHGTYTNREVSEISGLDENTVKTIDKQRLQEKYTVNGQTLIKPEEYARYLEIDEFKLHNGHRYATHIIDMRTGQYLVANE